MKRTGLTMALAALTAAGCGGGGGDDVLEGVDSIVFIQRQPQQGGMGDIFQNMPYNPPARLVTLSPPTADGKLEVICCDHLGPEFQNMDINGYDISYDASEIVFSGRLDGDPSYGLFVLDLATGEVEQLPTDPTRHYIYPIFLPGDVVMFNTTAVVEEGAPQFRDEYERGTTTQLGTIRRDGSNETLFARNLSHMVHGSVMYDGRVAVTQWDHLNGMNAGHLLTVNPDGTVRKEAFGKEGTGVTNSYYKAVEVAPGRLVAIGSSRDRTIQSGTILDIKLGLDDGNGGWTKEMSEANASYQILTPGVPLGREDSSATIGRYYSAFPLNNEEKPDLLVTWSDGPVQSETLAAAGLTAQFGIYLYDSAKNQRKPIYDDPDLWDVFPKPLVAREAPPVIAPQDSHPEAGDGVLIGSMNVYESSLDTFAPGSIYGVRIIEGFSVEEGVPNDFGIPRTEGAAVLGTAVVQPDGSWMARIPANVPVHIQTVDQFGMSLRSEPVWITGNAGEARVCGGCHESRSQTTVINPGITEALALGPADLMSSVPRYDGSGNSLRVSSNVALTSALDSVSEVTEVVGVPWGGDSGGGDISIQRIFTKDRPGGSCVSCHDGTPGPNNPSYTITDPATGATQTITFDLRGSTVDYGFGEEIVSGYSASHLSLMGPDMMEIEDAGLVIEGDMKIYVSPESARDSALIQKLNPPKLFTAYQGLASEPTKAEFTADMGTRAFPVTGDIHENMLTPQEYYLLILMADNGGQFYSRENAPGGNGYGN